MKDYIQVNNIKFKEHDKGKIGELNKAPTDIYCNNAQISLSDLDFKRDISILDLSLDFIDKLQPIKFKWVNGQRTHFGLSANDVKNLIDSENIDSKEFAPYIEDNGIKALRYSELLPIVINAIKELYEQNIWLVNKVADLIEVIENCCNGEDNSNTENDNNGNNNEYEIRLVANNNGQYRIKYDVYINNNSNEPIEVSSLKIYLRDDTHRYEKLDSIEVIPANSNIKLYTEYRDIQVEGIHQLYCDVIINGKIMTLFETITI